MATFPHYTRIRFQPACFPASCFQAVIQILLYQSPRNIVLERVGTLVAPLEVIRNLNDAIARLHALRAAAPDETGLPRVPNIIGLSLDRLQGPKRADLRTALKLWKQQNRYATTRNIARMTANPAFGGGGVAWMPGQDRCLIESWPQSYRSYGDRSCDSLLGRDVRDLPDSDYIIPTTRGYFTVAQQQAPRLELIEALVTRDDGSKFWSRYERLILPWRTSATDTFVTSVPLVRLVRAC
ncbi:hypothetical protein [Gluconacetobacter diazotrophicus]|uniref:Uncharacterized protein n=2 Tax=Gluconacetobacter diazotrophicus TaxID=33996 RepID=A9H5C8_GLUDA|nr:hypothetical protein [Gluconacetobacter diazotrophicus]CAP54313.1 hypothetical protein GDI0370 [Gluconacetobacter diazotrophicus PA1 5]